MEDSDVEEIIQTVFAETLLIRCTPTAPGDAKQAVQATVSVKGGWSGDITVRLPRLLSRRAAARMFQTEAEAVTGSDVVDAIGELSNQIAGSVKSLMPDAGLLSLPEPGPSHHSHDDAKVYWFDADGETFSVVLVPVENEDQQAGAA